MEQTKTKNLNDIYYLGAICATYALGRAKVPTAIGLCGSAKKLFLASEAELVQLHCFTDKQIGKFLTERKLDMPFKLKAFCEREGVRLLTLYSEDYPKSLRHIADPPLVLYCRGELPRYSYGVAIVGSRNCTSYGKDVTQLFSGALAKAGLPIISGGARGIDTTAHKGCLAAGGTTIAVLGCGIDVVYPSENKELFRCIAEHGAVLTEFAPGTRPLASNFPERNRIVVGLAQAVLVTEAQRKSGALITAHLASDEGREVYAVPGSIFTQKSLGCHDLIRKGATAVDCVEDILEGVAEYHAAQRNRGAQQSIFDFAVSDEELLAAEQQRKAEKLAAVQGETKKRIAQAPKLMNAKRLAEAKAQQLQEAKVKKLANLSTEAQKVYECLSEQTLSFDDIIEKSGVDFMILSMAILDLEFAGLIKDEGLQRYRRI